MADHIFSMRQDVVEHIDDGGGGRDIGRDALRIGGGCVLTAQFRGKQVLAFQHLRVYAPDRLGPCVPFPPHAAYDLAGKLSVAAVDVD